LWGQLVHESQERIFDLHGRDAFSLVIAHPASMPTATPPSPPK
jgi:hypothetical protein